MFLQKNGIPFQDGKLANRLPAFWGKSGVRNGIRVTETNIRKWIVTKCHTRKMEGEEVDEDVLRQAMCHSDKVARTHYLRMDKTAIAARASEIIARCTDDIDHNATAKHSQGQTRKQTTTPNQEQIIVVIIIIIIIIIIMSIYIPHILQFCKGEIGRQKMNLAAA